MVNHIMPFLCLKPFQVFQLLLDWKPEFLIWPISSHTLCPTHSPDCWQHSRPIKTSLACKPLSLHLPSAPALPPSIPKPCSFSSFKPQLKYYFLKEVFPDFTK